MSSLANAIKRKTHKERAQPAARRKYGLLEKKKDYLLRAKDYHKKDKTIKHLQSKAEQRNPDEFYFAMEKAQTKDGVHIQRSTEANKYTQQELLLMKTQDLKYLELKSRTEAAKAEKLKQNLHFIGMVPQNKHTVFVDSAAEAASFKASQFFDTPAELLGRTYNRPRTAQLQQQQAAPSTADADRVERRKAAAYRELSQRLERQQKLAGLASKMAFDKELMGKGRKRKLAGAAGGSSQPLCKWKRERKK